MEKIIIRAKNKELTIGMYIFASSSIKKFKQSLKDKTYGKNWTSCLYSDAEFKISCLVELSKAGTISACIFS